MITREADYAIRIVLALARHTDTAPVSAGAVSDEMGIPHRFVRKIAGRLVRAGLVRSLRGRAGGLRLARRPAAISLLDVLAAVDPASVTLNICLLDPRACRRAGLCEVHPHFASLQGALERGLASVSFAQLAWPRPEGAAHPGG